MNTYYSNRGRGAAQSSREYAAEIHRRRRARAIVPVLCSLFCI